MATKESIFTDLDLSIKTKVNMGNGDLVKSKGKGTVDVQTKKGTRFIKDVLLVPSLDQNLLSVGQMMQHGFSLHFKGNLCRIFDKKHDMEIAEVNMGRSINFPILWHCPKVMVATIDDSTLWHQRFGHYNYNALRLLHQKGMISDLPLVEAKNGEQITRPSITILEENSIDNQNVAEERIPQVIEKEELSSPETTAKRMRPLSEVYESCNFSSIEPNNFTEASMEVTALASKWIKVFRMS
ncbi:hypothetical protein EZV62_011985 [Acer yangbiense]|uniref:Uncharacterized protein n=1 Tax=Acer yangbiense TaxID=1000413 RepID=A0A5C7I6Z6_9ROSI|nr:hypothetical protein EZV62_011985 [Acer yangbiense]